MGPDEVEKDTTDGDEVLRDGLFTALVLSSRECTLSLAVQPAGWTRYAPLPKGLRRAGDGLVVVFVRVDVRCRARRKREGRRELAGLGVMGCSQV